MPRKKRSVCQSQRAKSRSYREWKIKKLQHNSQQTSRETISVKIKVLPRAFVNDVQSYLYWSLVKILEKRAFGKNITITNVEIIQTPETLGFVLIKIPVSNFDNNLDMDMPNVIPSKIKDFIVGKAITAARFIVQMNMGDFTTKNNTRLYRILLNDGTSSTNFTIFGKQMDLYPLTTYEPGKIIEIRNFRVDRNDGHAYAATTTWKITLSPTTTIHIRPDDRTPADDSKVMTLSELHARKVVSPKDKIMAIVEKIDRVENDKRVVWLRDDTKEEPTRLTINGKMALIFSQARMENQILVFCGLANDKEELHTTPDFFFYKPLPQNMEKLAQWLKDMTA